MCYSIPYAGQQITVQPRHRGNRSCACDLCVCVCDIPSPYRSTLHIPIPCHLPFPMISCVCSQEPIHTKLPVSQHPFPAHDQDIPVLILSNNTRFSRTTRSQTLPAPSPLPWRASRRKCVFHVPRETRGTRSQGNRSNMLVVDQGWVP